VPARDIAPLRSLRIGSDGVVAVVILALCAAVYAATWQFDTVSAFISQGMGPETFPRLVLGVIAGLAVLLAIQSRTQREPSHEKVPAMVLYTAAALVGFMLATLVLGMLASMALIVVGLGCLWGERRPVLLAGSAALLCVAIWAVFVRGFGVPLPTGLLGRLFS
jgi:putative tricarboxylic transport membrane protein